MKPLRELAKGYQYMKDDGGNSWVMFLALPSTTPTTALVWSYEGAPPECFADAKPEEPPREGDRVVVNCCCVDPGTGAPSGDEVYAGRHGAVVSVGLDTIAVKLDHSGLTRNFWLINLRHERADERLASPAVEADGPAAEMTSHSCTRAKEPEPVIGCKLLREDGGSLTEAHGRVFYPIGETVDVPGRGAFVAVKGNLESAIAEPKTGDIIAAFECWQKTSMPDPADVRFEFVSNLMLPDGVSTFRRVHRLPEIPMDRLHPDLRKEVEAWQAKHKPAEAKPDPEGWKREFYPIRASEFAGKSVLEAAEASLLVWKGRRDENLKRYGLTGPPITSDGNNCPLCKKTPVLGAIFRDCNKCPLHAVDATVCHNGGAYGMYINKGDPEPMIALLEECVRRERAKLEPPASPRGDAGRARGEPPRKFAAWWYEKDLMPCPPPLTDVQRMLNPGDKVRVRKERWDAQGKPILPSIVHPPLLSAGTILRSWGEGMGADYRVKCAVRFGMGADVAEYLHNLDPAESE